MMMDSISHKELKNKKPVMKGQKKASATAALSLALPVGIKPIGLISSNNNSVAFSGGVVSDQR